MSENKPFCSQCKHLRKLGTGELFYYYNEEATDEVQPGDYYCVANIKKVKKTLTSWYDTTHINRTIVENPANKNGMNACPDFEPKKNWWRALLETLYAFISGPAIEVPVQNYFVQKGKDWYFYDETWNLQGPYGSLQKAKEALREYAKGL